MPPEPRPVDILRFIASRPAGQPTRGADIPGLDAAGGSACIEWLAHCGLIEASVTASGYIVRGITAAGRALLAKASWPRTAPWFRGLSVLPGVVA